MKKTLITTLLLIIFASATLLAQRNYTAGEIQSKTAVQYGRFEFKMYSSDVSGTTSTFFMWKDGGTNNDVRWNELDIETFGKNPTSWQSNPIWEYNGGDQVTKRWEQIHNGVQIANAWVTFALEWTPNYIAWFNNGIQVRRINKGENVPSNHFRYNGGNSLDPVGNIADAMRMCFNHWATYPGDWLGAFNAADLPSYQFVDWLTYQKWNGNGFDGVSIRHDFNSMNEVTTNYSISTHTFAENQCQFSTKAVGVVNGFLWLGIFKNGQERTPTSEVPDGVIVSPVQYNHILPKKVEAEQFNRQLGLKTETVIATEGPGQNLAYIDAGDYAEYGIEVIKADNYNVDFRVASLAGNGGLSLLIDGQTVLNDLTIPSTGDWQNWTTITRTIALTAGKHTLRFNVLRTGFNLNWINFIQKANIAPSISLTAPINNATYTAPATFTVTANAIDSDGSIATVQFYNNNQLLATDNSAPFSYTINNSAAATYNITASATDNNGAIATTTVIKVVVNPANLPPNVSFTQPLNNDSFNEGDDIMANVNAQHTSGIQNVILYLDGALVRQESIAPYDWYDAVLKTLSPGKHELKAVATAINGASAVSIISITIVASNQNIIGITGPPCVTAGGIYNYKLTSEYSLKSNSWWTNSGAIISVDPANSKNATIQLPAQLNGTSFTIYSGANFSVSPWYKEYSITVKLGGCTAGQLRVGPQPFENETTLSLDNNQKIISLKILDAQGRLALSKEGINTMTYTIGSELAAGIFLLYVTTEEGVFVSKIFKQ